MKHAVVLLPFVIALCACTAEDARPEAPEAAAQSAAASADSGLAVTSLLGTTLLPPDPVPNQAKLAADLERARAEWAAAPDDPDALIWVARREGYLWRYHDAIALLSEGIERWPDNARLYRHRGHRYITVRDFPRALADLERAAHLIDGRPDEIEPDGAPNPAGVPRTTLAYNIWYHLGLVHYLQGDYEAALAAYDELLKTSAADNDDSIVAVTDWMWMSLMRLGREEEARALLGKITPDMEILENHSYHRRLLVYKGLQPPESLLAPETADTTDIATQGYGVANYYLVTGDAAKARHVLDKILAGPGWNAFGYIAAEADVHRMARAQ